MKIIDAHSHIDYITHLIQPDVVGTVCCTEHESQWQQLLDLADRKGGIYPAFGIHPWGLGSLTDGYIDRLCELLKTNRSFMVGEIGLDKYRPNMKKQVEVFINQFDLAIKLKRPVFLHCVGAWDKILQILKQYKKSELPLIIAHDYNASKEITDNLLQNYNVFFSFNKIDKDHGSCRIEQIPSNKILVETDGKYGVVLCDVVNQIATIKNDENIPNIIYDNTLRILDNVAVTSN